jgi:hypothetical protein
MCDAGCFLGENTLLQRPFSFSQNGSRLVSVLQLIGEFPTVFVDCQVFEPDYVNRGQLFVQIVGGNHADDPRLAFETVGKTHKRTDFRGRQVFARAEINDDVFCRAPDAHFRRQGVLEQFNVLVAFARVRKINELFFF